MHLARLLPLIAPCMLSVAAISQGPPASVRILPYPIDLPSGFESAIKQKTRTMIGRPGQEHWTNYAHYDIALTVDPADSKVRGRARMTYKNRSPDDLDRLVVHCYQDMMKAGTQRTRFVTATNGLEISKVMIGEENVRARARDTTMTLRLRDSLEPGEEVSVTIEYAFDIPKAGTAPRMGYEGDRVIYLGYWYPQFAVYDDVEGWVADPYRGNGEFYMDYADYDLAITAPEGYIVRATGVIATQRHAISGE